MSRSRLNLFLFTPLVLVALACSENPTAPTQRLSPEVSERTIFAPLLLPSDADWGHYFVSFNRDRALDVDVIHHRDGRVTGDGTFAIPLVGVGALRVLTGGADPAQGCTPEGTACDADHTVPEGSYAAGVAAVNGRTGTFQLHLVSHFWPNPTNTYDTATLTLCFAICRDYQFFGELHHEP